MEGHSGTIITALTLPWVGGRRERREKDVEGGLICSVIWISMVMCLILCENVMNCEVISAQPISEMKAIYD